MNRFSFHPATPTTGPKHDAVREIFRTAALGLRDVFGEEGSREISLAFTKLEEGMHWANAHIALNS